MRLAKLTRRGHDLERIGEKAADIHQLEAQEILARVARAARMNIVTPAGC
jgi:hypothetical protein